MVGISIHAPVKGATPRGAFPAYGSDNFNPRSREGSDPSSVDLRSALSNFNPRSREGSDDTHVQGTCRFKNFNPRSREGSDNSRLKSLRRFKISIHAPVKGATR